MAYKKTVWVDGTTKLNAEHLNHIEDGLEEASNNVDELSTSKAECEVIAVGAFRSYSFAELRKYKFVIIYGYKDGVAAPNQVCIPLIPDQLSNQTLLQYVCAALSTVWEYRLQMNVGGDGNVYWFTDIEYSGNNQFVATKIVGVK